ncbi:HlyD family efflux transporter periplasmic adaptor subunit [Pantoea ananatis]|uniref:efflux RND transporter periplasmic adaptor subunit n=1 Tax=Pantoea ananas TaxID=553 RepID=UPI00221EABE0|nr:HlyD family efflux transporter periplasmic adaptor subunit [Pantoea ananatis]
MATLDPIDANAQRVLSASQLEAARSLVANMQAQVRQADADAQRLQTLAGQQLVSRSQYEQAVAQRDALRAQLQNAQRNVSVAGNQLSISDLNVDNTIVRAPFSGVVTAKAAQPGEIVSPLSAGGGFTRTGIGTIVDMDSLEIEVEVGESYIGRVKPGMPVDTPKRVALKQKDARIVPEMGVRVSFLEAPQPQTQNTPQGVRVPGAAIVKREGQDVAFAVKEGSCSCSAVAVAVAVAVRRPSGFSPRWPPLRKGTRQVKSKTAKATTAAAALATATEKSKAKATVTTSPPSANASPPPRPPPGTPPCPPSSPCATSPRPTSAAPRKSRSCTASTWISPVATSSP